MIVVDIVPPAARPVQGRSESDPNGVPAGARRDSGTRGKDDPLV
jgi:hypothetical protein